jgi:predicted RecB family nuclease
MISRITMDGLESYLFCRYKGYLKWIGHQGIKSDYEVLLAGARDEVRLTVIEKLITQHPQDQTPRGVTLTNSVLKQGLPFILETTLEDATISLSFDGLKKEPGPSKLGDFHYIPMSFHGENKIRKVHQLMLEIYGLFLSRHQGIMPGHAIIWHGKESKATKIQLNPDPRNAEQLLKGLQDMLNSGGPPKLILNQHCQVCEFRGVLSMTSLDLSHVLPTDLFPHHASPLKVSLQFSVKPLSTVRTPINKRLSLLRIERRGIGRARRAGKRQFGFVHL